MKSFCLILLVVTSLAGGLSTSPAQTIDTLSQAARNSRLVHYRGNDITRQLARFDLPTPGHITEIRVMMGGDSANGTARLRLFGYEGGGPVPAIEKDLCSPINIIKSRPGVEEVIVPLPEPVLVDNAQFFVAIEGISPGTYLLSDNVVKEPVCVAASKRYHYQFLQGSDGSWRSGPYSYAITVSVEREEREAHPFFLDVTEQLVGDSMVTENRSIAWGDINHDSYVDLLAGGRLFLNNGDETFTEISDRYRLSGIPSANLFLDINNDRHIDLLFIRIQPEEEGGEILNSVFLNDGVGNFTEQRLSLPSLPHLTSISITDMDGDGYLDLFLGQDGSKANLEPRNYVMLNTKGLDFKDASREFPAITSMSHVRGAMWKDLDRNGMQDLLMTGSAQEAPSIWLAGQKEGGAESITMSTQNDAAWQGSSGGDWADYDNDGTVDLFLPVDIKARRVKESNLTGVSLYSYEDQEDEGRTRAIHISGIDYTDARSGGSWGDVNNDGYMDLFAATSCSCNQGEIYIQQSGSGNFIRETFEYGLQGLSAGPDGIWVDYNNDGKIDLVTFIEGELRLFKNNAPGSHNYIAVELEAVNGNTTGVGGAVTVHAGENRYTREVSLGRGLLMQDPAVLHFGIGSITAIDSVTVQWPGTQSAETFTEIEANRLNKLKEGTSRHLVSSGQITATLSPNPFHSRLSMTMYLPVQQQVTIDIYSLDGTHVKRLGEGERDAGEHTVIWDGTNSSNIRVSQGTYIYRITGAQSGETSGRVALIH